MSRPNDFVPDDLGRRPEFPELPSIAAERLPLLVTGIAGVAGYQAFLALRARYGTAVFGQRRRDNRRLTGPGVLAFDLEDPVALRQAFETHRFRSVLDAGGSCALKHCEADPAMAERVNVAATQLVIDQVRRFGARLVRLSIDLVHGGGTGGGHVEEDRAEPVTVYGRTMLDAERRVAEQLPEALMLRISLPMGPSFNGHAGAIDWIRHRFRHGKQATLYFDEVRTPTYTDCLNPIFERALAGNEAGLLHCGGVRPLSLYEIGQIVSRVGGYDPTLLRGCYRIEAGPMPPRAGNVTLDSRRLSRVLELPACAPWPEHEEQVPTDRRWHERRDGESGSEALLEATLFRRSSGVRLA